MVIEILENNRYRYMRTQGHELDSNYAGSSLRWVDPANKSLWEIRIYGTDTLLEFCETIREAARFLQQYIDEIQNDEKKI